MVQVLNDIEVCLVNSMVLENMEDWLKLNAVESFLIFPQMQSTVECRTHALFLGVG